MSDFNMPPGVSARDIPGNESEEETVLRMATDYANEAGWNGRKDNAAFPPGKYEGERWYAPYFFNAVVMDGMGERWGPWEVAELSDAETKVFDIPDTFMLGVREDGNGFVHMKEWSEDEWDVFRHEWESENGPRNAE